jgi:hypothetical protein
MISALQYQAMLHFFFFAEVRNGVKIFLVFSGLINCNSEEIRLQSFHVHEFACSYQNLFF